MSLALLQTALFLPLETLVNRVLALDAASASRLARLEGRILAVCSSQPALRLFIRIRAGKLGLSALCDEEPDATLSGSASALLGLLLNREPVHSLGRHGVELRGSTRFVQDLQTLLLDLDIDWEYHLSRLTGDVPAALLGAGISAGGQAAAQGFAAARASVNDYLTHESGWFVAPEELTQFADDLLQLGLRIDRLQARLNLLGQSPAHKTQGNA